MELKTNLGVNLDLSKVRRVWTSQERVFIAYKATIAVIVDWIDCQSKAEAEMLASRIGEDMKAAKRRREYYRLGIAGALSALYLILCT